MSGTEADQQRQALIEGFINMSDMQALREDQEGRIFTRGGNPAAGSAGPTDLDANDYGKDYVEMDDDLTAAGGGGGRKGKLGAGEMKENMNVYKGAFHVFKANVGTGVFMLPTFYIDAGYVVSVLLALGIGTIVIDCTHFLLNTKLAINRRDITTYSQVCRFIFGTPMEWLLFVALALTQFGFCLMYSQLASGTMDQLVHFEGSNYLWVSLVCIICFPMTCFSDNLSLLAIASVTATISVIYALVCCLIESCIKLGGNGISPTVSAAGRDIPIGWFNNLANNMMVLEGIGIILPVHESCTQKRLVPRMVTCVLVVVVTWYLLFGLTGYLAYGTELKTSLVAALDNSGFAKSIRVFFIINIIGSYPVQFQSAMQLIDKIAGCTPRSWLGLGIRLLINLIIWGLSMGLGADAVNVVVAFIGALPSTCIVLIIPSMLVLQTQYALEHPDEDRTSGHYLKMMFTGNGKCFSFQRIRAFTYLVIAILIMVIGTYSIVVKDLIG